MTNQENWKKTEFQSESIFASIERPQNIPKRTSLENEVKNEVKNELKNEPKGLKHPEKRN